MSRIAYVNGRYVPHGAAAVHIEDRGYQFADGVYEVIDVEGSRLIDEKPHLDRLDRSLRELAIAWPVARRALKVILREIIRRNRLESGFVYLQVTRGVAPRDHAYPQASRPALTVTARHLTRGAREKGVEKGVAVITIPDIRWKRRDIKTIALLPNIMGKQAAKKKGAFEAWMVEADGTITEGTSSNAWIVTKKGELVTRRADEDILNGVTRLAVLAIAKRRKLKLVERPFTPAEARRAAEAFTTSTTARVKPVVSIDGKKIGTGKPGPVVADIIHFYREYVGTQA